MWLELQDNVVAMQRVFELMDAPPEHTPSRPIPIDDLREGFAYAPVILFRQPAEHTRVGMAAQRDQRRRQQ